MTFSIPQFADDGVFFVVVGFFFTFVYFFVHQSSGCRPFCEARKMDKRRQGKTIEKLSTWTPDKGHTFVAASHFAVYLQTNGDEMPAPVLQLRLEHFYLVFVRLISLSFGF